MHTPVLLQEAVESLDIHQGGRYIDATLGEGGHTREIVNKGGMVLGIDWDKHQIEKLKPSLPDKSIFVQGNYADIERIAKENNFDQVDGVLFDLGLSMEQLNTSNRGFSYKKEDEPLDMRIGQDEEETAADILNYKSEEELYNIFAKYSEELDSKQIAQEVVSRRIKHRFEVVSDLVKAVEYALNTCKQGHTHILSRSLSRIFQALRIEVNHELENIRKGLEGALQVTKKNGRIAIITFHSIEDRVVKQFIRSRQLKAEDIVKGNKEFAFERSATLRVITV